MCHLFRLRWVTVLCGLFEMERPRTVAGLRRGFVRQRAP